MKRRFHQNCLLVLAWIIFFSTNYFSAYSQDEVAQVSDQFEEFTLKLPKACLRQTISDTILPTISNSGMGLLNYKRILNENTVKTGRKIIITNDDGFTESEIDILREQQHLMDEQYHKELEKQMRNDKLDLQLGELIKGFYLQPPF